MQTLNNMQKKNFEEAIAQIVNKEVKNYREKILDAAEAHYNNQYCASTDIGTVMYKNELNSLVNSIRIHLDRPVVDEDLFDKILANEPMPPV